MKFKIAVFINSALLLGSPLAKVLTAVAQPQVVQAAVPGNKRSISADFGLSEYDQLFQHAGPSDGMVDWYPTRDALGLYPKAQELVKQLISLSQATGDNSAKVGKALFNNTNGASEDPDDAAIYQKYRLAFGFIAQILSFNNEKTGQGAKLKQGAVAGDDPSDSSTGNSEIAGDITQDPIPGQGINIADVLGAAFFGDPDAAYAQLYLNGYDNVMQNESDIIREGTSSITIVAQSKITGRKATAIFKLNNKTLPHSPDNTKLNNYRDRTVYALDDKDGNPDIAGLNMTTTPQKVIDHLNFSKAVAFWADNKAGGGTIIVPRGTTAQEIAQLISQRKMTSNHTLTEIAPVKAIQAATTKGKSAGFKKIAGTDKKWADVSYSHYYVGTRYNIYQGRPAGNFNANPAGLNHTPAFSDSVNGPENYRPEKLTQYRELNNLFNDEGSSDLTTSNGIFETGSTPTRDAWFGGSTANDYHMIDTNQLFTAGKFDNTSAKSLPNLIQSEGTPWDNDDSLPQAKNMKGQTNKVAGVSDPTKTTNIGKVQHLFQPSSYFKEAYDANHFVNNNPEIENKDVTAIAQEIAHNGSFSSPSSQGQIKKSFTYEAPVASWFYKSYNNPYSTVMSSAGGSTFDGKVINGNWDNLTTSPQSYLDLNDPENSDVIKTNENDDSKIKLSNNAYVKEIKPQDAEYLKKNGVVPVSNDTKLFYFFGTYPKDMALNLSQVALKIDLPSVDVNLELRLINYTASMKLGTVGTDSLRVAYGNSDVMLHENSPQPKIINMGSMGPFSMGSFDLKEVNNVNFGEEDKQYLPGVTSNTSSPFPQYSLEIKKAPFNKIQMLNDSQYFVQTWDRNTATKNSQGKFIDNPTPLIYNKSILLLPSDYGAYSTATVNQVDSPNFESKYFVNGFFALQPVPNEHQKYAITSWSINEQYNQAASSNSKRAYFNSNLYNNPQGAFAKGQKYQNNSRFFVSQDFAIGPVSSDMINDAGSVGSGVNINQTYYPYGKGDPQGGTFEANAAKILELAVKYNNPQNNKLNKKADANLKSEFTDQGTDGNGQGNDGTGYKLVSVADAANKQGVSENALASELAKVTGKDINEVKRIKWVQATLPRLKRHAGTARINVVIYDKTPNKKLTKPDTKPSFSTTDISQGNDPFNVKFRPYTTLYDDGAVLKGADVPQNFKNLLDSSLVVGNQDLIEHPDHLSQILVNAFLNSWQQNDGSFDQTDTAVGVNSPLYLYGGFGISNSDSKNSYSQWPDGYVTNTGDYLKATNYFSDDFYRGGKDLKLVGGDKISGIPVSALQADVSHINLRQAGSYPVDFIYTNPDNAKDTAKITVPVTVKATAAPVFVFQNGNDVTLKAGDYFDRNNYKVVGNRQILNKYQGDYQKIVNGEGIAKDDNGNLRITITGQVEPNTPGIYQLIYEATNLAGITTKLNRKIQVLPKEDVNKDWTLIAMKGIGYINYVPNYGINVWYKPNGIFTGQRLLHGTVWKIFQKAVNSKGQVYYQVGSNQWIDGQYVSFDPISAMQPLKGIAAVNYVPGYGINLWRTPSTTGGYYERKLAHGSKWKVFGQQNNFYNIGNNQWLEAKYAIFKAQ